MQRQVRAAAKPAQPTTRLPRAFGAVLFDQEFAALAGAVGVTGEGEDLGVVHQPIDHGAATTSAETLSPQRPKGRLLMTMTEPCS